MVKIENKEVLQWIINKNWQRRGETDWLVTREG